MKRLFIIFLNITLLFSFFSCKKQENASKFFSSLKAVDTLIQRSDNAKALASLIALGNSATDSKQVLSIAKRMLSIHATPEAIKFLQTSITKISDSPEIVALLIATLIDSGRTETISEYAPLVKNTVYAALVAEAVATRGNKAEDLIAIDPYSWEQAYRLTYKQAFLKMGALSFCKDGKISQAEFLRESIPTGEIIQDPFFWGCVSFDLGHFDFIFKNINNAILNAENAGVFEQDNLDVNKASRHLLLAADAAYSVGDVDVARSYWQTCADLPLSMPIALYNLALTSENEEEKARLFIECIEKYPNYYPAISSYIRQYLILKDSEVSDEVTKYLAERGFYSMKMEDIYLGLPNMVYSPEKLLETALTIEGHDPRIAIEYFRYKHYKSIDFKAGIADMWNLLAKYPENADIKTYAKWYFSHCRDFNACFSVGKTGNEALDAFYLGLEKAVRSSTDDDIIDSFTKASEVPEYRVFATANIAYVYYQQGLKDKAIETLSTASSLTNNPIIKSRLHYQLALMLSQVKSYDRAISVLGYAIELDPENYPAQVLLEKLRALK
ncbi:MAG: tetratricopeptide repeat protein [Treponema sp.]